MEKLKDFVKRSFNKEAFKNTSFAEFKKAYDPNMFSKYGGIEVVFEELTGKKPISDDSKAGKINPKSDKD